MRANEIEFGVADEPGWYPFNLGDSIVCDLMAFYDLRRSSVTHPAVPVRYRNEWRDDGMGVEFCSGITRPTSSG